MILCVKTGHWLCILLWVFIKSVFNKDRNQYGYNIFLEKGSYQVADK